MQEIENRRKDDKLLKWLPTVLTALFMVVSIVGSIVTLSMATQNFKDEVDSLKAKESETNEKVDKMDGKIDKINDLLSNLSIRMAVIESKTK